MTFYECDVLSKPTIYYRYYKVLIKAKLWRIVKKDYVLEDFFTVVTVYFSVLYRAHTTASTIYFPSSSNAATKCICDLEVITLLFRYLNMNWLNKIAY